LPVTTAPACDSLKVAGVRRASGVVAGWQTAAVDVPAHDNWVRKRGPVHVPEKSGTTCTAVLPLTLPAVPVTVTRPGRLAVITPAGLTVATVPSLVDQVTAVRGAPA
jgi:hypothetical protein